MKLIIFGLTMSSSWGNGHATIWRGLCRALTEWGHQVVFFERDVPYYAVHRDFVPFEGLELVLYFHWEAVRERARRELADADVALVTSYCPDGIPASELVIDAYRPLKVFYDLDTAVTLERLSQGKPLSYIGPHGLAEFDLVLSFVGGAALDALRHRLGAVRVAPLYGSADPRAHRPAPASSHYAADLSYLGTYSPDRQESVERLFLEPARRRPDRSFLLGGPLFPRTIGWPSNVRRIEHVSPLDHPAFYCSSPLTLNVTRGAMARMGYCPPSRLFEAAACAAPVVSDTWEGLDAFFEPGREIWIADETEAVVEAISLPQEELTRMGRAARRRVLEEHTCERRAQEMLRWFETPDGPHQEHALAPKSRAASKH